jgi:V/A-type H+-transporting ATPase subunit E
MIKEAADELGGNDFIIQLNEADTQTLKDQLKESSSDVSTFQIEDINFKFGEPIETMGGAILKTSNGDIEVNNTIESRLDRFKSVLRSEVANILFK